MLVLTRKINEQITIGDNIRLTIVRVKGNTVRVGIDAPRDVKIVRGELVDRDNDAKAQCDLGDDRSGSKAFANDVHEGDDAIDARATVFAHPESVAQARKAVEDNAASDSKRQVFVGRFRRDEYTNQRIDAPLSRFMTAT